MPTLQITPKDDEVLVITAPGGQRVYIHPCTDESGRPTRSVKIDAPIEFNISRVTHDGTARNSFIDFRALDHREVERRGA